MQRPPIVPERIRRPEKGFAFIPNRFLHDGFLSSLSDAERSLYLFLVLAGDRNGISFYGYDRICTVLEMLPDDFVQIRNRLIECDLIAFDGTRFQVLSLPERPRTRSRQALVTQDDFEREDPATMRQTIRASLGIKP